MDIRSSKLTDLSQPVQLSLFDLPQESFAPFDTLSASKELSPDASSLGHAVNPSKNPSSLGHAVNPSKSSLPSPSREKLAALDKTLDQIRQKYGEDSIVRGSFLSRREKK